MISFEQLKELNIAGGFSSRSKNGRSFKKWKHIGSFDVRFLESLIEEVMICNKDEQLHLFLTKKGCLAPLLIRAGKKNYYLAPIEKGMKKSKITIKVWKQTRKKMKSAVFGGEK